MSSSSKGLSDLSSEEKRRLLLKLLQKKVKEPRSHPLPQQDGMGALDQFTIHVKELNSQATLDPAIRIRSEYVEPVDEPARIFLTGATGFLGIFLLHELLIQTRAEIHCLVRCSTEEEGNARIQKNLQHYAPLNSSHLSRIIPVPGDLSQPLLGLPAQQFQRLANQVDCIYHCAANVNWIYPYNRLKPTNVLGTQEVLKLACQGKIKPVHFISSVSVFPLVSDNGPKVIYESDSLDHGGILYGGYTQSKWVAEKVVTIARSRGLPVAIYRPGLITGHSQTGAWNTYDITCKMMKSWIELGYAPDLDAGTDMTPVNYVSKGIVHLSRQPHALGKTFHLTNPQPVHVRDMAAWIRSFGYPLTLVPYQRWREGLLELARYSRENASASLAPLFTMGLAENEPRAELHQEKALDGLGTVIVSQYGSSFIKFDGQNAQHGLEGSSVLCPPIDVRLFHIYLSYFIESGFLDPP